MDSPKTGARLQDFLVHVALSLRVALRHGFTDRAARTEAVAARAMVGRIPSSIFLSGTGTHRLAPEATYHRFTSVIAALPTEDRSLLLYYLSVLYASSKFSDDEDLWALLHAHARAAVLDASIIGTFWTFKESDIHAHPHAHSHILNAYWRFKYIVGGAMAGPADGPGHTFLDDRVARDILYDASSSQGPAISWILASA